MPRCPSCGFPVDDTISTCPSCDTLLPWHADVTPLADVDADATTLAASLPTEGDEAAVNLVPKGRGEARTSASRLVYQSRPHSTNAISFTGLLFVGAILAAGLFACYLASGSAQHATRHTT